MRGVPYYKYSNRAHIKILRSFEGKKTLKYFEADGNCKMPENNLTERNS
jgi:hypothetical protein